MPSTVQGSSGMSGAASQLLHLQWRAAVLPVNILLSWTQYTTAAIVHTFIALGLFPQGTSSQKAVGANSGTPTADPAVLDPDVTPSAAAP